VLVEDTHFNGLKRYTIEEIEYCFILEDTNKNSNTFKVNIPKLMPFIPIAKPTEEEEILDDNIIINSRDSYRGLVNKRVKTQNYISVRKRKDCLFNYYPDTFESNIRMKCEILNKDVSRIVLIDDEFTTSKINKYKTLYISNPNNDFLFKINTGDEIKFIIKDFYTRSYDSCPNNEYHYPKKHGDSSSCTILKYNELSGKVINKFNWGVEVDVSGITHPVPTSDILGFFRDSKKYYSEFN
jgi:hypothetical protein